MKKLKILSIVSLGVFTLYAIGKTIQEITEIKAYETMKNEIDEVYNENQAIKAELQNEKIKNVDLRNKLVNK